jgi:hypothetical protein
VLRHGRRSQYPVLRETLDALVATLTELGNQQFEVPPIRAVWRADTGHAQWTAARLAESLPRLPQAEVWASLGPPEGPYMSIDGAQEALKTAIDDFFASNAGGQAGCQRTTLVIIGHEPALGWLLDGRVVGPVPPPLGRAEIACLYRTTKKAKWRVWWVLTPSSAAGIEQLREKVNSKMTSVALLAGFALTVAVETVLRTDDLKHDTWGSATTAAAGALFGLAAVLLVGALLAYDELMMPHRYWSSVRGRRRWLRLPRSHRFDGMRRLTVWRPPSSAGWLIYQESMRIWRRFVHLALALLVLGLGFLTAGAAVPLDQEDVAVGLVALVFLLIVAVVSRHHPSIGVSD